MPIRCGHLPEQDHQKGHIVRKHYSVSPLSRGSESLSRLNAWVFTWAAPAGKAEKLNVMI